MTNSTIKPKIGQCCDCPPGTPDQPITAGRCNSFHYKLHRSKVNAEKNKDKEKAPRTPIPKFSVRRKKENREYLIKRLQFLAQPGNQRCFIEGCNNRADTVEHTAGRWGKNYLDTSTWKPCCNFHNLELEKNSDLSEKYQLSKISGKKKIIKR
ncbi:hypothetical protein [Chryseobacterium aquifrigidense]|uniref:Uncharacterized protein n=1 Tax=Chryseobacterium aquifrigidense TaxID=558021 RepID=A0A543E9N6_9FLAO|nr:hypothetical protein [Chryseobacterium aquifrigidense]TQM18297.1 hypothetical protein FB551_4078 [Chryseobacterium aquifrigidense]